MGPDIAQRPASQNHHALSHFRDDVTPSFLWRGAARQYPRKYCRRAATHFRSTAWLRGTGIPTSLANEKPATRAGLSFGGEGGIRTLDGLFNPYSLSRGAPSATRPPLRTGCNRDCQDVTPGYQDAPEGARIPFDGYGVKILPGLVQCPCPDDSSARSCWMRLNISSRCTCTSGGASMPIRIWLPFTPSTVTMTLSPMTSFSPTRLVKISMSPFPWYQARTLPGAPVSLY